MTETQDRVCILGMGYVGLTLAVVMSECGFEVIGIEIDPVKVDALTQGNAHFFEAGLQTRLARAVRSGRLRFTSDHLAEDLTTCSVFVVTVGTPLGQDGQPRMDMVERAVGHVAAVMPDGALVVLRSTVKLGTTRKVAKPILDATGRDYDLAYCPERTIEGRALEELRTLPQVVGGLDDRGVWRAATLFQHLTPTTMRVSSLEAAEVIKLLDNSYRDLFFAFGNEVALLCEAAGLDGQEVIQAANSGYERTSIAAPGMVGGPCLEKDPHILVASMREFDYTPELVRSGRRINEELPHSVIELLESDVMAMDGQDVQIAVCGLAYKGRPETDDLRGTPALYLIDALRKRLPSARLVGQDFAVSDAGIESLGLEPVDVAGAFAGSRLVIIANNNRRYAELDLDELLSSMSTPGVVFDMWDCLQPHQPGDDAGVRVLTFGSVTASRRGAS